MSGYLYTIGSGLLNAGATVAGAGVSVGTTVAGAGWNNFIQPVASAGINNVVIPAFTYTANNVVPVVATGLQIAADNAAPLARALLNQLGKDAQVFARIARRNALPVATALGTGAWNGAWAAGAFLANNAVIPVAAGFRNGVTGSFAWGTMAIAAYLVGGRVFGKITETLYGGVATKVSEEAAKVNPTELAGKITPFVTDFFNKVVADLNLGGGGLGEKFNANIKDFWEKYNLADVTAKIMDEFNKAYEEGLKHANISGNTKHFTDEIEKIMEVLRTASFRQIEGLRDDAQQIFANMARDTAIKTVPWLALGTAISVGTPLAVTYAYHKAKHNIGRPKLATEVRYVGFYNRSTDLLLNSVSGLWNSSLVGLKYAFGVGALGGGTAVAANVVSLVQKGTPLFDTTAKMTKAFDMFKIATLGTGVGITLINAGMLALKSIKESRAKQHKPVFHKELNETIENITKSTYNLQKHGGFFQNVLLYGPGGTGKTMISKFMAKNSNMNYVMMSGGDLAQYISRGEHVTELNRLFEAAKASSTPTILFIDEAESLCRDRNNITKSELIELQNAFLNHTGEASNKIMLVMATNMVEDLDPAVLSRMDHKLFIGPPKLNERKQIIQNYLPHFFTANEIKDLFTNEVVGSIATKTEGLTGRTIFKMLNAIQGNKKSSADNRLTKEIIATGVRKIVEQEARLAEIIKAKAEARAKTAITPATETAAAAA